MSKLVARFLEHYTDTNDDEEWDPLEYLESVSIWLITNCQQVSPHVIFSVDEDERNFFIAGAASL